MKQFINIPAKVILGNATNITGSAYWPYNSGNDPYWQFGATPKLYCWTMQLAISEQYHSSPYTRNPFLYTGMDVQVGDYIADLMTGTALKIINVMSKIDLIVNCEVEDTFRYNTYRDSSGAGNGVFNEGADTVVFAVNEEGQPVIDLVSASGLNGNFYTNVSSRFQNLEQSYNFILKKVAHGFSFGDLISVDPANQTFVESAPQYPFMIGTVSDLDLGPDAFTIVPFEKIIDNYDYLLGKVGSIIYSDINNPGELSLEGSQPILIKLIDQSNSICQGSISNPSTAPGNNFIVNNTTVTIGGTGSAADFILAVNNTTVQSGVVAYNFVPSTVVQPIGQPAGVLLVPASASFNGVTVTFTTTTLGSLSVAPGYANLYDIASDINAANIDSLTAKAFYGPSGYSINLTDSSSNSVTIVNISNDVNGTPVAGVNSATNFPLFTAAETAEFMAIQAIDARAIDLLDTSGTPTLDFGLVSAENGIKAAAVTIEQGVRNTAAYVVTNIAGRDALTAVLGDTVFVQNVGDGNWGYYIQTLSGWVMIADEPSSETDAQTGEATITPTSNATGVIHTITNGRRVSFVTVTVNQAFDTSSTITIGDSGQNDRLMAADENDLTVVGDYSTTPAYTYAPGFDTDISYFFSANSATVGNAVVAITYI